MHWGHPRPGWLFGSVFWQLAGIPALRLACGERIISPSCEIVEALGALTISLRHHALAR